MSNGPFEDKERTNSDPGNGRVIPQDLDTQPKGGVSAKGDILTKTGPVVVGRGAYSRGDGGVRGEHAIPDRLLD